MRSGVLLLATLGVASVVAPAEARSAPPDPTGLACPKQPRVVLPAGQERARRVLAPAGARRGRVCRYPELGPLESRSRVVTGARVLRDLTRRLNVLPPRTIVPTGCPYDGGPVFVLLLGYARGGPVGVRVSAFGCQHARNRHLTRVLPRTGARSLRLRGGQISWRRAGRLQTVRLD